MQNSLSIFSKTEGLISQFGLPIQWSDSIERQLRGIGVEVTERDRQNRVDLRDQPFVTIDGEDARDFDDAVLCFKQANHFQLIVAIADVSHYIQPQSPLDSEALLRSTSIYFPHRVIPMLPEQLSNGLCSLNPKVDRLVFAVDMKIGFDGIVTDYKFFDGVICSKARLTYSQVNEYLQTKALSNCSKLVVDNLDQLYSIYKCLQQARQSRGAMEFETTETRFILSKRFKIKKIVPVERNDAHKLIEEAMLVANFCAADFLLKKQRPGLFRNHLPPEREKIENLRHFLRTQGLILAGGENPQPIDFQRLAASILTHPNVQVIYSMLLRTQQQARYHHINEGHFGLSLDRYTHFTSPIRRYPDLMVHRAIRSVLASEPLVSIGEQCSVNERRAEDVSRQLEQWLKCEYLQQHLGEIFNGTIVAVTQFGVFVSLDDLFIDGLVHISNLDSDYYDYEEVTHSLRGRRLGRQYQMGDRLKVRVASANSEELKIDFLLANSKRHSKNQTKSKNSYQSKRSNKYGKSKR